MALNGVNRDNRKKQTCCSQYSSNFNRILFFILKNLIFKRHTGFLGSGRKSWTLDSGR